MKSEKRSPLECMINTVNWIGIVIMGLAIALFLVTITVIVNKKPNPTTTLNLELSYKLNPDSLIINNSQFDERNKLLFDEINKTLTSYDAKIKSIIATEEDKNKWFTYVTGFLSILIAFATFFGFKSVFEMKKEAIETAEREAKIIAEKKAESIAKSVAIQEIKDQFKSIKTDLEIELKTCLKSEITEQFDIIKSRNNSLMDQSKSDLENLILKVEEILGSLKRPPLDPEENEGRNDDAPDGEAPNGDKPEGATPETNDDGITFE